MKTTSKIAVAAFAVALPLSGCATYDQQSRTTKGAVIGTAGGAAVGSAIGAVAGGGKGAWKGALIGAALGGVGGGLIGHYQDKQAAEMQAILAEQDRLRREQENIYISLGSDVLFTSGSAQLQPGGRDKLRELAGIMARYPRTYVSIVGHTDSRGSEQSNIELSQRRARAVADELVSQGVSSGRIRTRGEGESKPIASNETPEGRQMNRRVDITVSPDEGLREEAANAPAEEPR